MERVSAAYFDGESSTPRPATVQRIDDRLLVDVTDEPRHRRQRLRRNRGRDRQGEHPRRDQH